MGRKAALCPCMQLLRLRLHTAEINEEDGWVAGRDVYDVLPTRRTK